MICKKCDRDLPESDFWKNSVKRSDLNGKCKHCCLAERKAKDTPEKRAARLEYSRKYYQQNKTEILAKQKTGYRLKREKPKDFARVQHDRILRYKHGLTREDYDILFELQGGACAICGNGPDKKHPHLHLDHDHDSGLVRGLLCFSCNAGIGLLGDNPSLLERALVYLKNPGHSEHRVFSKLNVKDEGDPSGMEN